ncbi:MAG: hypothetical protein CMH62_00935 [Nanoarchaeota archaeon]|nr:hypothetical protein [Nanoarchaeota archaeon]|tara:strand:+ start:1479 stop:1751 length:273 start_codon:yes stop_codon:yes gene_type:complete
MSIYQLERDLAEFILPPKVEDLDFEEVASYSDELFEALQRGWIGLKKFYEDKRNLYGDETIMRLDGFSNDDWGLYKMLLTPEITEDLILP